ncbi:MAG: cardiolipin synthase [Sphaerochaetaceae bacterium]
MKKYLKFLTGRLATFIFLFLIQIAVVFWLVITIANGNALYFYLIYVFSFVIVFFVVSRDDNPAFKIAWIIVILTVPVLGVPFYVIFGNKRGGRQVARQVAKYRGYYEHGLNPALPQPQSEVFADLTANSPILARQAAYIRNLSGGALWRNTEVEYYALGELAFKRIQEEVTKAKRFILLEYFIIDEGEMWDAMLNLLISKVKEGVTVRLMYDDLGSIQTLPPHYESRLREAGLLVGIFNYMRPHLNPRLNYRDHRKILVIDGDVGFTGGINFADEYINRKIKFGHWKDTVVMLRGEAVWNLTSMFLQQWMFTTSELVDFSGFLPQRRYLTDGFVQPFGDSPLDDENIAENAYIQIINNARKYVWITTPYLIIDTQMSTALIIAAQSGVDVRIITPSFPDKWYIHPVTRSNYRVLLRAGVRIFEYTPGFIHAKMFVSDDEVSIVGTTNMDYRSFYLHFECGVAFYHSSMVGSVRNDITRTLEVCKEITLAQEESIPFHYRFCRDVLKLFSPLM